MELPRLKGFQEPKMIKYNFIVLGIVGFILGIICLIIFSFVRLWIENGYFSTTIVFYVGRDFMWLFGLILLFVVTILLHEFIHGMAFKFFGYKIKYGLFAPFAAYTIAENQLIKKRDQFFVVLAPLFILDTIAVFLLFLKISLLSDIAFFVLVVNTPGSVGDLWVALKIIKYPKGTLFFDYSPKDNYVYIPEILND